MIKADNVVTCLEFIKNDIKGKSFVSQIAQGKPKETIDQTIQSKNFTITLNLDEKNLER